jgi:MFS transporter, NNP family, nitrate/nitrite transporter
MEEIRNVGPSEKGERDPGAPTSPFIPILFLVVIFFLNVLARIILAPLMPIIEKDLKMGHDEAGSLLFFISLGYCFTLLGSGFVSSRLNHRRTIILSSMALGGALLSVALSYNLWWIRLGLTCLGMATGLYIPSGIAFITGLMSSKHWGKAIAIHEVAPNLAFAAAPLLSECLFGSLSWRGILIMLGTACLLSGTAFIYFGRAGETFGEAPSVKTFRMILAEPSFWIMVVLFGLAMGATVGVYTMIPLYLVTERGMERARANILLGFSRVLTFAMVILAGLATDRLGSKQTMKIVLLATGLFTVLLGIVPGSWILPIVFIQPLFSVCFFPPGYAALSQIGPSRIRNVVVSFAIPVSGLIGSGAVPAGIGFLGEAGSFALGITIVGALLLCGLIVLKYLRFQHDPSVLR